MRASTSSNVPISELVGSIASGAMYVGGERLRKYTGHAVAALDGDVEGMFRFRLPVDEREGLTRRVPSKLPCREDMELARERGRGPMGRAGMLRSGWVVRRLLVV